MATYDLNLPPDFPPYDLTQGNFEVCIPANGDDYYHLPEGTACTNDDQIAFIGTDGRAHTLDGQAGPYVTQGDPEDMERAKEQARVRECQQKFLRGEIDYRTEDYCERDLEPPELDKNEE